MTTPGDDESAASAGPGRTRRRALAALVAIAAAVLVLLGLLVAVLIGRSGAEANPLDTDAPALADATFRATGCRYEPDRGGLVTHFDVSTSDAGRFTVDLEAVTDEGADNLDISTTHVVRVTVPFYGGRTRKQFDVVVPLSETDHQHGYRKCRYTYNGTE